MNGIQELGFGLAVARRDPDFSSASPDPSHTATSPTRHKVVDDVLLVLVRFCSSLRLSMVRCQRESDCVLFKAGWEVWGCRELKEERGKRGTRQRDRGRESREGEMDY
uniref:Uncharacterized protein n=1 Tax=Astyanax mexicanus TaxID=7994 RepID=A0A3B1IXN6_ASTMX